MILADSSCTVSFLVESKAYSGVRKIAQKVTEDVFLVTDKKPELIDRLPGMAEGLVIAATYGKSELLDKLVEAQKLSVDGLIGKREVYQLALLENPFPGIANALVIAGSDKLGTIYGLFALSETIGVTAQVEFGDCVPKKQEKIVLSKDMEGISKEPSVRYRGFFINDEWPCFGNWAVNHFQGVNAKMYDHVFEFLLRMKGNFMWPAMWASSFPIDGPGSLNEELADEYGITIACSHHEPCLRASEEWDQVRGEGTRYGNEWNFYTNKEGLTEYWKDALQRSGKYNHLITIGMRGERDSSMLGPDASLKDNIDLLKDVISTQRKLIAENVNPDVDSVPQLLALYKEVEAYFYGDEQTEGLKEWKELENVIFMLCEDNFGHMRTLPTPEIRNHKGGFGMYYHFDYHGGPVSYEWMPSTPMPLIWEQMTEAYDYGIHDVWIVNVGDLKGNEVALEYFLTLAYDFDTWGSNAPNSWQRYIQNWAKQKFASATEEEQRAIAGIYTEFVALNATRRPECLKDNTYHPSHYNEAETILTRAIALEEQCDQLYNTLPKEELPGYYSMIYYPAKASINLIKMQIFAGKNARYAMQGRKIANLYAELVKKCIEKDCELSAEFGAFADGKWKGMELEKHIGFTKWNDDGWKYPVRMYVEPVTEPRMSVSRKDDDFLALKNYGTPACIEVFDFCEEGARKVEVEISNDGQGVLHYTILPQNGEIPGWLSISAAEGAVEEFSIITLTCDRDKLPLMRDEVELMISDGDTRVLLKVAGCRKDLSALPIHTHLQRNGVIMMHATDYSKKQDTKQAAYQLLEGHGRSHGAMKVLPSTQEFTNQDARPSLTYSFCLEEAGKYVVELWTSPANLLVDKRAVRVELVSEQEREILEILPANYRAGEYSTPKWVQGVLDQIHKTATVKCFKEGVNTLTIAALEAGVVLEKILIYPENKKPKASYLGPTDSYCIKREEK